MGDLFFCHVDQVSRQLFDLSSLKEKFNTSSFVTRPLKRSHDSPESVADKKIVYTNASFMIHSRYIFFSTSTFSQHRQFRNNKENMRRAIDYLIENQLLYQASGDVRFLKGTHTSYAMATPRQIKNNDLCVKALVDLNLNLDDYEKLWNQCLLPEPDIATKIDKGAIDHINVNLHDYLSILHRLGYANDPVAQKVLKPGLRNGQIDIDFNFKIFSFTSEQSLDFRTDDEINQLLSTLCSRVTGQKNSDLFRNTTSPITDQSTAISMIAESMIDVSQSKEVEISVPVITNDTLPTLKLTEMVSTDIYLHDHRRITVFNEQQLSDTTVNDIEVTSNTDSDGINDCKFILENIKAHLEDGTAINISSQYELLYSVERRDEPPPTTNIPEQKISYDPSLNERGSITGVEASGTESPLSSIEYDDFTAGSVNTDDSDNILLSETTSLEQSTSSSSISIDRRDNTEDNTIDSDPIKIVNESFFQNLPSSRTASVEKDNGSDNTSSTCSQRSTSTKSFDIVSLSKRIIIKPFLTFTKTDATRLYNNAETKNVVIEYLQEHEFIIQIDNLFLSNSPSRKAVKSEIGYLKLFPKSLSAFEAALFETKLREKIGITFDDYTRKILRGESSNKSTSPVNNMFNTTHHTWLLNRSWYEKFNTGYFSAYYENNVICPDSYLSAMKVSVPSVSNDNVRDLFDRSRSRLTASQRTNKELNRLGAKRQTESDGEPLPKRQRKPKRFADEDL